MPFQVFFHYAAVLTLCSPRFAPGPSSVSAQEPGPKESANWGGGHGHRDDLPAQWSTAFVVDRVPAPHRSLLAIPRELPFRRARDGSAVPLHLDRRRHRAEV